MQRKGFILGALGVVYRGGEQWTGMQGRDSISGREHTTKTVVMESTVQLAEEATEEEVAWFVCLRSW